MLKPPLMEEKKNKLLVVPKLDLNKDNEDGKQEETNLDLS